MEKYTAYSFYKLVFFLFYPFFTKILSVSSQPTTASIIDIMQKDTELCNLPQFVYENNIIKNCRSVKYPDEKNVTDCDATTLLCLAFYDTWYKVCNYNTSNQMQFNSTTFNSYILKFFPKENDDTFCENIKTVTFSYKKLKPFISLVHFNDTRACYSTCISPTLKFVPLCAVLAWNKNFDQNMINETKIKEAQFKQLSSNIRVQQSGNSNINEIKTKPKQLEQQSQNSNTNSNEPAKDILTDNVKHSSIKPVLTQSVQVSSQVEPNIEIIHKNEVLKDQKISENTNADAVNTVGKNDNSISQIKPNKTKSKDLFENKAAESQKASENTNTDAIKVVEISNKVAPQIRSESVNTNKNEGSVNNNVNAVNDVEKNKEFTSKKKSELKSILTDVVSENQKPSENMNDDTVNNVENNKKPPSDVKPSTISENTQDLENSMNQEEWGDIAEGKSPYDPNDGSDHLLDTSDQNQNIPEPSEQREIIPRYHSIRSDGESHFFTYFTIISLISITAYIGYHNKQKILAIILEGRRSRSNHGRRRPSTANYRKLDCTLEEAVTSQCNANVTHVIY